MAKKNLLWGILGILFAMLVIGCPTGETKKDDYTPSQPAILPSPTGLKGVVKSYSSVELTWDMVSGAYAYQIQCKKSSDADTAYSNYAMEKTTTYLIKNLDHSTSYDFRLATLNSILNTGSYCSPISITTDQFPSPTGVLARSVDGHSDMVKVSWKADTESSSIRYRVYYKKYNGSDTGTTGLTEDSMSSLFTSLADYTVSGLEALTEYIFYVKSTIKNIDSDYSGYAIAKTNVAKPTNLQVNFNRQEASVNIRWDSVPSATYYKVYRKEIANPWTDSSGVESATLVDIVTVTQKTITGLSTDKYYKFFIQAFNSDGGGTADFALCVWIK